jgi:spermidine synthase
MTNHEPAPSLASSVPAPETSAAHHLRPFLPLLLVLFAGSGCAALIYEIVWFQMLQLAIGSSAISLGVLLGTFMGGMCLGSLLLPKLVAAPRHPLRVYAALESGIGTCALLVLWSIPHLDRFYAFIAAHGFQGIALRAVLAGVCLLIPTLLMGASLPAIARWIETTPEGVSWLGFFYGGNIAGAVFGSLLAGFYLLRIFDMAVATYVAVAINAAVALISFALARHTVFRAPAEASTAATPALRAPGAWAVYIAIGISGMCALGAEVIWTRLLAIMMGATVYTFSIILAMFLVGLGIGSTVGSLLSKTQNKNRPRLLLGWCQFLAAAGVAWAAYSLADALPNWPINPLLATSPWFNFQVDLMRAMWVVLPAACLWGASFPLALAAIAAPGQDPGRLVGETYAANTVGAILGAMGFSLIFIPGIGSQDSQRLLIALAAVAALLVLLPLPRALRSGGLKLPAGLALIAAACAAVLLIRTVDEVPWLAVAYGRRMLTSADGAGRPLYRGEGMNSDIVVSQLDSGQIYFHVSGKVEASTEPFDMRLQRMLGHLPALIHPDPKSVLIVGFGAGVTAGTFAVHPEVQKITICELEKLIPPATSRYFGKEEHHVLDDPRTTVVYDDARHYVLTTPQKFDLITSDPIHPWVKGTATLYSKEYFEICKRHLNPGGVITQWVPLYESDLDTIKTELATFFEVFPNGTIWANDINGEGYDVVLLGVNGPATIDVDQMQRRFRGPVAQSLNDVGFSTVFDLLGTYVTRASDLQTWLKGAYVNTDLDLRLQYMAGMGLNFNDAPYIRQEIARSRQFPADLFKGSAENIRLVRTALRE